MLEIHKNKRKYWKQIYHFICLVSLVVLDLQLPSHVWMLIRSVYNEAVLSVFMYLL